MTETLRMPERPKRRDTEAIAKRNIAALESALLYGAGSAIRTALRDVSILLGELRAERAAYDSLYLQHEFALKRAARLAHSLNAALSDRLEDERAAVEERLADSHGAVDPLEAPLKWGWTHHGHPANEVVSLKHKPKDVHRCGGPRMCGRCKADAERIKDSVAAGRALLPEPPTMGITKRP